MKHAVLLDSTVLVDVVRARSRHRESLAELVRSGWLLATSTVNIAEVYSGVRPEEERRLQDFLSEVDCYPVTVEIARRAGQLRNEWARKGRTLSLPDMIVAATALTHDLPLMTDNRKDFPMPTLKFHG